MLRVLELFAGIGACSKALTNLGVEHEIVDAVEIDKEYYEIAKKRIEDAQDTYTDDLPQ